MDPLLSVRLVDGFGNDRHVKHRDLSWRKTSSGGWASLQVTVITAIGDFTDLGPNDRIYVYDTTGQCVMEGYLDNPGRTVGPAGELYNITASGPSTLASDAAFPYIVVDQQADGWERSKYSTKNATTNTDEVDVDTPALEVSAAEGKTVATGWTGDWIYRGLYNAGQKLARVKASTLAGIASSNYKQQILTRQDPTGGAAATVSNDADTSSGTVAASVGATNFSNGHNIASLRAFRSGTATTGAESHWFQFYDFAIRAMLKDASGADITTGYVSDFVYLHEIVTDMIGRGMLPSVDPSRVTIDTFTQAIAQFAFGDGVTAAGVFDAGLTYEPDLTWGYGASNAAGHEFWARLWDDESARYELDETRDGVTFPGGDNDVCNRIVVGYTDLKGKQRTVTVSSDTITRGTYRDADSVTLPQEYGTAAIATAFGTALLDRKAEPGLAGTALVRRRIFDMMLGRYVNPWEIEAGWPVRVRDRGVVLRMPEMTYDHNGRAATLTLGAPVLTPEQLIADLTKRGPILTAKPVTPGVLSATHHLKGTAKARG